MSHRALSPVLRWEHIDGIAPYSGDVPVLHNSCRMLQHEYEVDTLVAACQQTAVEIDARGIIRIDCRQDRHGQWRMFDVNLKPSLTGCGRPGRDDQCGLLAIAYGGTAESYANLIELLAVFRWGREQRTDS